MWAPSTGLGECGQRHRNTEEPRAEELVLPLPRWDGRAMGTAPAPHRLHLHSRGGERSFEPWMPFLRGCKGVGARKNVPRPPGPWVAHFCARLYFTGALQTQRRRKPPQVITCVTYLLLLLTASSGVRQTQREKLAGEAAMQPRRPSPPPAARSSEEVQSLVAH